MIRVLVATGSLFLVACAGIRVESTTWRPLRSTEMAASTSQQRLVATGDATLTSLEDWSEEPLGDSLWLMAGATGAPAAWITLLTFDLSPLPVEQSISAATLRLFVRNDPPLPQPEGEQRFLVYHVVESFEEGTITWMAPPRVYPEPVAVFVVAPGIGGMQPASDTVDLTAHVAAALAGGAQQLSLAILPDDAVLAYRRLWNSRETLPEDPFTASPLGPVLEVVFGAPPASRTAAERDASR